MIEMRNKEFDWRKNSWRFIVIVKTRTPQRMEKLLDNFEEIEFFRADSFKDRKTALEDILAPKANKFVRLPLRVKIRSSRRVS